MRKYFANITTLLLQRTLNFTQCFHVQISRYKTHIVASPPKWSSDCLSVQIHIKTTFAKLVQ